jgi:subtilisin-like proprotein convertase family protein
VTTSPSNATDYLIVKYSPNGDELWVRRYAAPPGHFAHLKGIALDSAGNAVVAGDTFGPGGVSAFLTVKYDPSGTLQWSALDDWQASNNFVTAMAVDTAGNAYVTGSSWRGNPRRHYFLTVKYSPTGNLLWLATRSAANGQHAIARDLKVDAQGNVIITGYETRPVSEDEDAFEVVTVKYDPAGNELWSARSTFQRSPRALALDAAGNIYVGGCADCDTQQRALLLKYAPNGSQLWETTWPSANFKDLAIDGAGNVYVIDDFDEGATGWAMETRKFVQTPIPSQLTATIVPALNEVFAGSSVTLTAAVSGAGPFTYRWQYFGYGRIGGTNASFTITNAQFAWGSQGDYSVVVSNAAGYTISPEARVTILRPPLIQLQTATNQYASIGQQLTFTTGAFGTEPFSYQWHFNGNPIPGATSNVFTLANTQVPNAGNYTVAVTNRAGRATSDVVRLVLVLPPVSITNMATIQINSNNVTPYPSELFVHDVAEKVLKVTVTLCGLTHLYPDDLAVFVQGPAGQSVLLMSGVGEEDRANDFTLTFDDDALSPLTPYRISSGTFKPSIYGGSGPLPPAPAEWDATLSVFSGADPNGTWRLFVSNAGAERGEIACGWRLTLFVADPNTTGRPRITSIVRAGDHILLRWDGAPGCKLQRSSSLANPMWSEVPGSEGQSGIPLLIGTGNEFFRLTL